MLFVSPRSNLIRATLIWAVAIASASDGWAETARLDRAQTGASQAEAESAYVGRYYIRGVRDVGAELTLGADGQFTYLMSYGAVDRTATGRWRVNGSRMTLTTNPTQPASLKLGRVSDLVASPYSDPGERKTLFVVEVASPALGMVWSNMQVTAEFSNKKQRSGLTGRNGMLGFDQRDEDEWKDASITRVRVEYPRVKADSGWIDIIATQTRTLTVVFEPGELITPPFKELLLDITDDPNNGPSLVLMKENGEPVTGVKFTR